MFEANEFPVSVTQHFMFLLFYLSALLQESERKLVSTKAHKFVQKGGCLPFFKTDTVINHLRKKSYYLQNSHLGKFSLRKDICLIFSITKARFRLYHCEPFTLFKPKPAENYAYTNLACVIPPKKFL